jgi:hypothetical protein
MIANVLMISCKKATELIEKKSVVTELTFGEKLQLRMHTAMCKACTNYQKQSIFIDNALKYNSTNPANNSHEHIERVNNLISKMLDKK